MYGYRAAPPSPTIVHPTLELLQGGGSRAEEEDGAKGGCLAVYACVSVCARACVRACASRCVSMSVDLRWYVCLQA